VHDAADAAPLGFKKCGCLLRSEDVEQTSLRAA
jgi:hypothetical protein